MEKITDKKYFDRILKDLIRSCYLKGFMKCIDINRSKSDEVIIIVDVINSLMEGFNKEKEVKELNRIFNELKRTDILDDLKAYKDINNNYIKEVEKSLEIMKKNHNGTLDLFIKKIEKE